MQNKTIHNHQHQNPKPYSRKLSRVLSLASVTAAGLVLANPMQAAVQTVTSPVGTFTNPGGANAGDPIAFDTWLRRNVRNNGEVGITTDYARSGNGSALFNGPNPIGTSSKADFEYLFSDTTGKTLGSLSALSYDWYRDSVSTAGAHFHPALRLYFDADGSDSTTSDRGYLVYERAYNPNAAAVPTDSWQSDDVFNFNGSGLSANLWMVNFGNPNGSVLEIFNRDLNQWLTTANPNVAYPTLSSSTVIYGISAGIGSGWAPFRGAVDNITIGFGANDPTTYNFEVAVPEPSSLALLGFGIVGSALVAWQRRRMS